MIPESAVQKFRASLRGQSFCPGEQGYDAARTVPNAMIDRRPAIIARCAGPADVIASVRFAASTTSLFRFGAEATVWRESPYVTAA
jgi:hypothetical protein